MLDTPRLLAGASEDEGGGILSVDLSAVADNWRRLAQRAAPAACAAVVKADAYGCGLEPVVRVLAGVGCTTFFVASLSEGRRARAAAPGVAVYVLTVLPNTMRCCAESNLRPVIGNLEMFDEWRAVRGAGWHGTAALHIDTGMNRLGLSRGAVTELLSSKMSTRTGLDLLMSHFVCSEQPGHPLNIRQMKAFRELRTRFPDVPGSLANSSGIFLDGNACHDLVRPGVALYGGNPTPGRTNPMRPVLRLEAPVVQVRDVQIDETVGYGATWTARRPTRLAIVAIGYSHGFLRAAGASDSKPGAAAIVAGRLSPLAGRVSMDLIAVDVSDLPPGTPRRGDPVVLLDEKISVDDLAFHAHTISYEVLASLGPRHRRVYRGHDNAPSTGEITAAFAAAGASAA